MSIDRYVYDEKDVPTYVPVGHTGTVNRRLIGAAKNFHLVMGTLEKGAEAKRHSHPDLEQGMYVLQGRALIEIGGEGKEVGPGGVVFLPAGLPHRVEALSEEPTRLLIVYSPPLKAHPE
ncbi:MAG: cupin domain-containing protein [Nitrospinota bacterium]